MDIIRTSCKHPEKILKKFWEHPENILRTSENIFEHLWTWTSPHIPYICKFWYTTTLFRPAKSTQKMCKYPILAARGQTKPKFCITIAKKERGSFKIEHPLLQEWHQSNIKSSFFVPFQWRSLVLLQKFYLNVSYRRSLTVLLARQENDRYVNFASGLFFQKWLHVREAFKY